MTVKRRFPRITLETMLWIAVHRQGRIRYTVRGIFAETTLAQAVERLLAEGDDAGEVAP